MTIDTFEISDSAVFNLTDEYLLERYRQFNEKYFGGKLPQWIKIKVVSTKEKYLGMCHTKGQYNRYSKKFLAKPTCTIDMNVFFERNEKTYCSTLLHEMIHVYEACVLLACPDHKENFINKMNEINSATDNKWDVSTTETVEEHNSRGSAPQSTLNLLKKSYRICAVMKNSTVHAFLVKDTTVKDFNWLMERYPDNRLYKILDGSPFVEWKACRKTASYGSWLCRSWEDFEQRYEGKLAPITEDDSIESDVDIEKQLRTKCRRIEKNCYFCYCYGDAFLIQKNDIREGETQEMLERYGELRIFNIIDGTSIVKENISICKKSVKSRYYYSEDWVEKMIKNGEIKEFDYWDLYESRRRRNRNRLTESVCSIVNELEQDPMITVNKVRKVDDDTIELDMDII